MRRRLFDALRRAQAEKRAVALVTDLGTGLQTLVHADAQEGDVALEDEFLPQVRDAIRRDRSGIVEFYEGRFFIQVQNPPLRLIIIGAVHIAQALAPMAALAGYDVTVVDPRRAFATDARFPAITLNGSGRMTPWPPWPLTTAPPSSL
ncbi:XdhC family protein [Aerophototrophica crusticola]|uniref:XdhC family protein n=1 Tax=Aerophototrophica crusticola TaxID=1709002 RepID=UPI00384E9212